MKRNNTPKITVEDMSYKNNNETKKNSGKMMKEMVTDLDGIFKNNGSLNH
jgi:hypothetical protein